MDFGVRRLARCCALMGVGAVAGLCEARAQFTQFTWSGSTDSVWTNAANWNANGVAQTGGVFEARLNVQNNTGNTLVYDASLGHTIYNPTSGATARALVIGNPGAGSMVISGGVFESQASQPDIIGNSSNGSLPAYGGELQTSRREARS